MTVPDGQGEAGREDPTRHGSAHRAEAFEGKSTRIVLDLRMELDAESPRDQVELEGTPPITLKTARKRSGQIITEDDSRA